jgi:hypothetical protein
VRTIRGEVDFEGVGRESKGVMREGRVRAFHVKRGGCASRRSESEKENSRDGGQGQEGRFLQRGQKQATCQGVATMPERGIA